jgi:hypothetical protein
MREEISSNLPLGYTLELVGDPCVHSAPPRR